MIRMLARLLPLAVVVMCTVAPLTLAQTPVPPGGSGTVIAMAANGMATVQVGDKQQTVHLPDAQVGDKVDCKVRNEKWECTVKPK